MTEKEIRIQTINEFVSRLHVERARPVRWATYQDVVTVKDISMIAQEMLEESERGWM